jgi:hypothetical protein
MLKNKYYVGQVVYGFISNDNPEKLKIKLMLEDIITKKLMYVLEKFESSYALILFEDKIFNTELEAINSLQVAVGHNFYTFVNDKIKGPRIVKGTARKIEGDYITIDAPLSSSIVMYHKSTCFRTERQLHLFLKELMNAPSPNKDHASDSLYYRCSYSGKLYDKKTLMDALLNGDWHL